MYLNPVHIKSITTILKTYIFIVGLKPSIADQVENITVALGRDAKLQCQVKDLQDYKVIPFIS